MKSAPSLVWTCLGLGLVVSAFAADDTADTHFLGRVKPLLESRCVGCHGPEKQQGSLRLDSLEGALKGGDLGPAIAPANPHESLLLKAVRHVDPDLAMPPKDRLSDAEIAAFEHWLRQGAPWPPAANEDGTPDRALAGERIGDAWSDPRNPIVRIFSGQRLDLWSLRVPQRPELPPESNAPSPSPPLNPVDRFIDLRLAAAGRARSPEADRRTLARRLTQDLTGLPATPEMVEAFLTDARPDAYERLVDTLLASPRYGEHQARLWLDVVRYSDSNGFDWDEFRPQAWRFRDYVVRAFNRDLPFDQFIREQLAGDELVDAAPKNAAEQDALVATGYLRIGPQDNSASLFNEQARARAEWLADLTETTASAFLGLTMSCCRCHDHKFDPLSQADHFRLRAFFEPVRYGDDLALDLEPEQAAIRQQHAGVDAQIEPIARERDALVAGVKERLRGERLARLSDEDRRLLALATDPQPQDFKEQAAEVAKKLEATDDEAATATTAAERERYDRLGKEIERLRKTRRPFTRGLLATDTTNQVSVTRIHYQGDPAAEREPVVPGFLSILDPNPAPIPPPPNPRTTGRRLALANWIASASNPLTSRVFVNRVWQSLFGNGLVATPNDFGLAGARPTHPELLDWLAIEFRDGGWSVKRLHRLLVTSATYRQSSRIPLDPQVDAENTLLSRQNLRRLSAEQFRDSALSVAGALQTRLGGPPIWPELPAEVLQANPAFLDDNSEKTKGWYPSPAAERSVRSVFLVQKRTVRVPFLEAFDLPDNSVSCPRRNVSIVAPQALALLNSPEMIAAAAALAGRVASDTGEAPQAVVSRAFALTLQREPTDREMASCVRFLERASLAELARALLNLNEFAFLD